jgi:alanyl-tRNA synthetase
METRSGNQIREDFLRFFEGKVSPVTGQGHRRVHSSSLVPANDPTLLFTNAGMNQFKDVFLGAERREYSRATTSQKCVRAGGKHNDLENVGFTRRHHTFFEMLGNFSFGDYFKRDAIAYAWELLTKVWGIDPAKMYVTIFEGDASVPRDDEAYKFWVEAGVPAERILAMGVKENFWAMGDTGPCGPCSEIYYDFGVESADVPGTDLPFPQDEQRYVEIWNLVFMQFDRGSNGVLTPLPKPSIDTGMGLERVAAVLQGKLSNYESDLFGMLIAAAVDLGGDGLLNPDGTEMDVDQICLSDRKDAASFRIIADHSRAATFLIADGVHPSNDGRGYVLRKILRRAIRHGRNLNIPHPFLTRMVYAVRDQMLNAYPELNESADNVARIVLAEEQQFQRVLEVGSRQLENLIFDVQARTPPSFAYFATHFDGLVEPALSQLQEVTRSLIAKGLGRLPIDQRKTELKHAYEALGHGELAWTVANDITVEAILPGHDAFAIYETFGLPKDFISDAARDAGVEFDDAGFEKAKEEEQARARTSWKGGSQKTASPVYRELAKTEFEGYSSLRVDGAHVLALVKDGVGVAELKPGEAGEVVLDATSFYADSGGQVGDVGWLYGAGHSTLVADVSGASKPVQGVWAHRVVARERIAVGDTVDTVVDGEVRAAVTRNHTGTHLLHAALREVLGRHVKQAGSSVDRARLRFDFSHFAGVAEEELAQVEEIVNRQVLANTAVETMVDVPIDIAVQELGAMALFGEKYGDRVRVVRIGDFSTELCGGTHTRATGEIGLVKLVGEGSVSSGVRRVEAVSGWGALGEFRRDYEVARVVGQMIGADAPAPADALRTRIAATEEEMKKLRRELDAARMKSASAAAGDAAAVEVKGVKLLVQRVDGLERGPMRDLVDQMRSRLGSGVVVLGAASADGKVSLIAGVTKDLTGKVHAGKVVGTLATMVGGKGGGRPDLAEAGGSDASALDGALAKAAEVVGGLL